MQRMGRNEKLKRKIEQVMGGDCGFNPRPVESHVRFRGGGVGLHRYTVTGHLHYFTVTFAFRRSSDLSEPHQPGGRHLQRGSRGHAEQPGGGAAHYLTAKRCSVRVLLMNA